MLLGMGQTEAGGESNRGYIIRKQLVGGTGPQAQQEPALSFLFPLNYLETF